MFVLATRHVPASLSFVSGDTRTAIFQVQWKALQNRAVERLPCGTGAIEAEDWKSRNYISRLFSGRTYRNFPVHGKAIQSIAVDRHPKYKYFFVSLVSVLSLHETFEHLYLPTLWTIIVTNMVEHMFANLLNS